MEFLSSRYSCQDAMHTMVTAIVLMVVITAVGITGKAMVINTVTSTTVIGP